MLDRQKVETILRRRFTGATDQQVAAAANAIMALDDECEESVASRSVCRPEDDGRHLAIESFTFKGEGR